MVKILFCGDVGGQLEQLFNRVDTLNRSSNGPFDMLFCAGNLLSEETGGIQALKPYISLDRQVPVPTYFHDPGVAAGNMPEELCPNLTYLGARAGIRTGGGLTVVERLTVAFLGRTHTAADIDAIRQQVGKEGYMGADVLLTSQWACGIDINLPTLVVDQFAGVGGSLSAKGTQGPATVAALVRPRYHFAAGEGWFFQRPPYRNSEAKPHDKRVHITRFIGLGKVAKGKDKARKWLHAISADPCAFMAYDALVQEPPGTTSCPYLLSEGPTTKRQRTGGFGMNEADKILDAEGNQRSDAGMFFFGQKGKTPEHMSARQRHMGGQKAGGGRGNYRERLIHVGNLPPGPRDLTMEKALMDVFEQAGPIRNVVLPSNRDYAVIHYDTREACNRALDTLQDVCVKGHRTSIVWSQKMQEMTDEEMKIKGDQDPDARTLFMVGFREETQKRELYEFAEQVGKVDFIRTKETYAFVEYEHHEYAVRALRELNGKVLNGRQIKLKWAYNREVMPKKAEKRHQSRKPEQALPLSECWFCLSSSRVETHLITSIADEMYLTLPKGPVDPDHVLIVPIAHSSRQSDLTPAARAELGKYKLSLHNFYRSKGLCLVTLDRCIMAKNDTHGHIQAFPVPVEVAGMIEHTIAESARGKGYRIQELQAHEEADQVLQKEKSRYFFIEIFKDRAGAEPRRLVAWVPKNVALALQWGRDVIVKLLHRPDKANWKDCQLSKEQESKESDRFKEEFKPFDFSRVET